MNRFALSDLALFCAGELIGTDREVLGAVADHRQVKQGSLFFALAGARRDGHEFVDAAVANGAVGAVVSRKAEYPCPVILVPDTKGALIQMAKARLSYSAARVVAVTGSVGKTTVKEMTAAALGAELKTFASPGNFNTEIGLPLSVLNHSDEAVLVLEMGMRGMGQIEELTHIAPPDVAIITNVGEAHIELLGTRENISYAKGEILLGMKLGGTAVLCRDDDFYEYHQGLSRGPVLSVGYHPSSDFKLSQVAERDDGCCEYLLVSDGEKHRVRVPWPGRHNALNSAMAIAAAVVLGIDIVRAIYGLEQCATKSQRLEVSQLASGCMLIDDTYNASPPSMLSALETLTRMAGGKRKIAVLGSMFELGARSYAAHREIGQAAAKCCDLVVTLGKEAQAIAEETRAMGIRTVECRDYTEVVAFLASELKSGDAVLVKGSRGLQMERITAKLRGGAD